MTQDEIRAIALEVAKELLDEPLNIGQAEHYTDFATRFLAAITAKAEPVVDPNCTCDEHGACAYCWNGKKHDTHPATEPAPQQASRDLQHEHTMNQFKEVCHGRNCTANKAQPTHSAECKADHDNVVCAPPLPDDVAQMVATLREMCWDECDSAADMVERLARQVPEGCVVVQRKVTEEAKCVLATPGNYRTYQDQWAALIAAGEVKP